MRLTLGLAWMAVAAASLVVLWLPEAATVPLWPACTAAIP